MRDFNYYEITGVVAPGMILLVGAVLLIFPDQKEGIVSLANVSVGSFGVGLILSFVAGQLLQAVGNGVETAWWSLWGGKPTDWIRSDTHGLVAPAQRTLILKRVGEMIKQDDFNASAVNASEWYAITRQIYAEVESAGKEKRVNIFGGNYGQHRGLAAGFIVLLAASSIFGSQPWQVPVALSILAILAIYRMHRFGKIYGRELFVQFMAISNNSQKDTKS